LTSHPPGGATCDDCQVTGQSLPTEGASPPRIIDAVIDAPDRRLRADRRLSQIALWTGIIFIPAGLVKFVFHHWELHAFHSFGLPLAPELEILAGVLETVGGVLLIMRRWLVPNALLLGHDGRGDHLLGHPAR
jgi:hypothetical protein